jgi:hypothetical protein
MFVPVGATSLGFPPFEIVHAFPILEIGTRSRRVAARLVLAARLKRDHGLEAFMKLHKCNSLRSGDNSPSKATILTSIQVVISDVISAKTSAPRG